MQQTPPDYDTMSLAELKALEAEAIRSYDAASRSQRQAESRLSDVRYARRQKQYQLQHMTLKKRRSGSHSFTFEASPALLALLHRDGGGDMAPEEALFWVVEQAIADTEARLRRRQALAF